jgi:pilus assembly protein FimV
MPATAHAGVDSEKWASIQSRLAELNRPRNDGRGRDRAAGANDLGPQRQQAAPPAPDESAADASRPDVPGPVVRPAEADLLDLELALLDLDLARAYLDLNDAAAARTILEDVAVEGNDAQRTTARQLLARLE